MDLKRLAMRLKLNKVDCSVVYHCAILKKLLKEQGIDAKIIHGYCVSPGEVCEHFWVRTEDEGLDLDLGYELACLYTPELRQMRTMLTEEFPMELKHVEPLRQEENTRLFELYETDPVTFWKEAPRAVKIFR